MGLESKSDLHAEFEGGATPVWLAVQSDDVMVVHMLLEHKADPHHRGPDSQSAMDGAVSQEMKALFLQGYANSSSELSPPVFQCECFSGMLHSLWLRLALAASHCAVRVPIC